MKQSLIDAMCEAKQLSLKNQNVTYYVMDKKGGKARCHSEIIINNPIFFYEIYHKGYYPYRKFINGIESRA